MAGMVASAPGIGQDWQENLNLTAICKDCQEVPPNLVEEFSSGDLVCASCGLVLGGRIVDTRSEWRTFSNDDQAGDDPSRVGDGPNALLNGSQLQTSIAFGDGGGRARDLHRAQNKSTHDKGNKGLLAAYKEIGSHCDAIGLTKMVSDSAKSLFKMADDAKAFKGKSQDALIAGCIFIACRQCQVPRTFREIYALTKVSKKDIGRTFKALEKFLIEQEDHKLTTPGVSHMTDLSFQATTSTSAIDLCNRFISQLGLKGQGMVKVSQSLAEKVSSVGKLAGRSPLSIAAACIYMASALLGQPKTAKEISNIAGVSDGTIRTVYKHLYQDREKLIEPEWIANGKGSMSFLAE